MCVFLQKPDLSLSWPSQYHIFIHLADNRAI
jgi:hypothetical protein